MAFLHLPGPLLKPIDLVNDFICIALVELLPDMGLALGQLNVLILALTRSQVRGDRLRIVDLQGHFGGKVAVPIGLLERSVVGLDFVDVSNFKRLPAVLLLRSLVVALIDDHVDAGRLSIAVNVLFRRVVAAFRARPGVLLSTLYQILLSPEFEYSSVQF